MRWQHACMVREEVLDVTHAGLTNLPGAPWSAAFSAYILTYLAGMSQASSACCCAHHQAHGRPTGACWATGQQRAHRHIGCNALLLHAGNAAEPQLLCKRSHVG